MDSTKTRSIGTAYSIYILIAIILIAVGLLAYTISIIIWFENVKAVFKADKWWIIILPPIAYIFWVFTFICLTKGDEDKKTLKRQVAVYQAVQSINNSNLKGSDVKMRMGSYSAWLETRYDPKKRKQNLLTFLYRKSSWCK